MDDKQGVPLSGRRVCGVPVFELDDDLSAGNGVEVDEIFGGNGEF